MQIVRLTSTHGTYEGTLLPAAGSTVVLKLSNGYNIGIRREHITKEESLGSRPAPAAKPAHEIVQGNLPLIIVLHLGGTIAAKVDYATGATLPQFEPNELLEMVPELRSIARIESKLIRNMLSENMQPGQYNVIADAIAEALERKPAGIIIGHGTDMMQYTAAALSFALEGCPVPVILVGAQRSSDRGSSDAAQNLVAAVTFAATTHWRGVGVCMHAHTDDDVCWILPGTNVAKMHTSRRDAFRPVNRLPIATIDVPTRTITYVDPVVMPEQPLRIRKYDPALRVGLVKIHPGIRAPELSFFEHYDGIVIEGTGLGHAPIQVIDEETTENAAIFEALKRLAARIPVAMTSQCLYGRVSLQVYTPGRQLQDAGVLGHDCDMTSTCAYLKLLWLLANERDHARELFGTNLRGEISERTTPEHFFR